MAFLAPYMLWGALAAGIPVVLHFFFRSRYRKVPWAAMQFLLTSIEQTSRRVKFQELLLLLARVALLALIALALARPTSTAGPGSTAEAVDAVLVLDNSYSMDAREGPVTRFERAKEAARTILDHLPPHSTAQVVASSDRASLLGPREPADLDQARRLIDEMKLSHLATDFLPGLNEAAAALQRGQSSNKELYLFSDMQKLGWDQQADAVNRKLQELHNTAGLYLVRCGTRTPRNVGVLGIVPQSGIPHTGERAGFAVLVRNSGAEKVRNLRVSLTVDGQVSQRETQPVEELAPGETRAVTLTARLDKAGLRVLTAAVKNDDLEADNRYDQVIHVRDQVRILVVDGAPNEQEPERAGSFYLMHALLPVPDSARSTYHVQPHLVTARQAVLSLLADRELCILVNSAVQPDERNGQEALSPEFLDALAGFVRRGHGLMIFAGDRVTADPYNRLLYQQEKLLPLKPTGLGHGPVHLDRNSAGSTFFSLFRTDDYYKGLNAVEVRSRLVGEEPAKGDEAAQVVLRYADGRPAIATRRVESGEVMLVTTSADVAWSDWPIAKGMYVPLVDLALNHLLHAGTQSHNQTAGQPLHYHPPERQAGRSFAVVQPDGSRVRLGLPETAGGRPVVTAAETARAGVYRIQLADERKEEQTSASVASDRRERDGVPFAVVPDPRESEDLEALSDAQIDGRLGFRSVHLTAGGDLSAVADTERLNREWTIWVLAAVLGLVLVETGLAWLCGRAW
jgi:hypothetical protein